ncbi:MAG TPA: bifunctional sulfate adenylyltransferase/adenylylsulfate kinase [Gammaproteobacteria bacterium]|nr:bifunctional sulfate adenylyltransferase/adenylylsulfate kinase [Gammaproteobacteria bacterium]
MTPKWILTPRQRCDLDLLLIGGFSPLTGFLTEQDYHSVLSNLRLASGSLWPMPITLDVNETFADSIEPGQRIGLYDADNTLLAMMTVTDKWQPDKHLEAMHVFGTHDTKHPGVNYVLNQAGTWYLGGPVECIRQPVYYDFPELRSTPASLKAYFAHLGLKKIVGFQTRNPMHRAHVELTRRAAHEIDGHVLIHPVVGMTKPGDVDYVTRVRCYQKMLTHYPKQSATLSLLPLAMRMGGPREALWHALIRKNYGCTHFIVGRDHAGPGLDSTGKPFYDPYAAQALVQLYQKEMGIELVPFQEMVYIKERKHYAPINEIQTDETALSVSGTELREMLLHEKPIPEWFSFPEIIQELRDAYPSKKKQGFTLFFTGLSGAGKTTLANALLARLMSHGKRHITLLDGDVVRRILANELGFSRSDRDLNIRRIGFVASEVTKAGGIAICAAIAPYLNARNENRQLISQSGGYIEIYLSTSLQTCEERDIKGLYKKARLGELKSFTGIDDPYEHPVNPEITLDTARLDIETSVTKIIQFLEEQGYLALSHLTQKDTAEA